jgi:aminoglycoside phosphotransferase (APT) family kinase protein
VIGLGTDYGSSATSIAPQFLKNLVAIHDFDWRTASLPSFTAPSAYPNQAALWQANWYLRVWEQDAPESLPLASLMRHWLRANAPQSTNLCLVHADYRMGTFMFDERSGETTAVLDRELAHIRDFHEDVAYVTQKLFGLVNERGEFLCCGLFPREEFLSRYQEL